MPGYPTAEAAAAAIAPILDRLRVTIGRRVAGLAGDLGAQYAPGGSLPVMAMLRNLVPDRTVTVEQVREVFVYRPPTEVDASLAELAAADLLEVGGSVALTPRGRELLEALYGVAAGVIDELWAGHEARLEVLEPLVARVLAEAGRTGGDAFAVVAPPWEPADASTAVLVAERLTPLRFHRADAHIAAWRAAGLTAEAIQALEPGPAREAIETATNARAAAPYEVLAPDERFQLCTALGALPG